MATEYQKKKNRRKEIIVNGFRKTIQEEFSMHLILGCSIVTIGLAIFLGCSYLEWAFLILILGGMFGFEFFNTSLENLVDLKTKSYHKLAKASKDTGSAAEGMFSFFGILGILILLVPKIIEYIGW